MFDGLRPAFLGLIVGLAASAGTTQLIRSMLYGTAPTDPAVIGVVIFTLLLIAAFACIFPAWRASRLDPMQALRMDRVDILGISIHSAQYRRSTQGFINDLALLRLRPVRHRV